MTRKRKATSPSNENVIPQENLKSDRIASKKASKRNKVTEQDDERERTPSGTILSGAVRDNIRQFFSPNSSDKVASQNSLDSQENFKAHGQNHSTGKACDQEVSREISCNTVNLNDPVSALSSDTNNNNPLHVVINQLSEILPFDKVSDQFAHALNTSNSELDKEDQFLYQLAAMLPVADEKRIQEKMKEAQKKNLQNKKEDATMETSDQQQSESEMVSSIETNDDSNPENVSLAAVKLLLLDFKKQLTEENKKFRESMKQDVATIKVSSHQEIEQCIRQSEHVQNLQADLNY